MTLRRTHTANASLAERHDGILGPYYTGADMNWGPPKDATALLRQEETLQPVKLPPTDVPIQRSGPDWAGNK